MKKGQRPSRHIRKVRVGKYKLVCRRVLINPSVKRKPKKKIIKHYQRKKVEPEKRQIKKRVIVKEEIEEEEKQPESSNIYLVTERPERERLETKEPETKLVFYPKYVPITVNRAKGEKVSSVYNMNINPTHIRRVKVKPDNEPRPPYKRTKLVYIPYQKEFAKRWKIVKTDEPAKRYNPKTLQFYRERKRNIIKKDFEKFIRVQSKKKQPKQPSVSQINREQGFVTLEALKRKITTTQPKVEPFTPKSYPYPRPITKKKISNIIEEVEAK